MALTFGTPTTAMSAALLADTLAVDAPADLVDGCHVLLVAGFARSSGTSTDISVPTGFTAVGAEFTTTHTVRVRAYLKYVANASSEPATYSVTTPATSTITMMAVRVNGLPQTDFVQTAGTREASGASPWSMEDLTITAPAHYFGVACVRDSVTVSSSDMNQLAYVDTAALGSWSVQAKLFVGEMELPSGSTSGNFTISGGTTPQHMRYAFTLDVAASTATLSSPTSASVTQTGATIGATTDDATGTLYGVVTTSASAPSATQIKAGQDHTGSAAAGSGSNASLSVGANTIAITGLTAATSYYYYLVQDNGADSNVVNGTFTTAVAAPTLTSPTAVSIGTTTVTPRVTTDTGNGTCYYVITPQAEGEPSNTQVEAGTNAADGVPVASGSQVVSTAGVITFSEVTGLSAGTAYRISYAHSGTPS